MLDPHDRRILMEALRPPEGFVVDRVLATTYSLDLLALLTAPLAFSLYDRFASSPDEEGHRDPISATAVLQAIREHARRFTVFCQAGAIASPPRYPQLLAYLEESVVEVRAPSPGGIFHPKVWVQRFCSAGGAVFYRLLVCSRNLTFDRSWDTMLVLEGPLVDQATAIAKNRPLTEFVATLPGMALRPTTQRVRDDVDLLAQELLRVRFERPWPFEDHVFWPLGHDARLRHPLSTRIDRLLVVSPFLAASQLGKLRGERTNDILVSRAEELERIPGPQLLQYAQVYVLQEGAEGAPDEAPEDSQGLPDTSPSGLHAKLYVADAGWDAHVWTGSANASNAAFSSNVEFVVQLTGKKSKVGVDAFLQAGGATSFQAMLTRFVAPQTDVVDLVEEALRQQLRTLREQLTCDPWTARIEAEPGPDKREIYAIRLAGPASVAAPPGSALRCWPISLAEHQSAPLQDAGQGLSAEFRRCSFQAITSFFAIEMIVAASDQKEKKEKAVKRRKKRKRSL